MTELDTLVEPLKRTMAVPGTFADVFPATTDQDLTDTLLDAFAEAQLDGFLAGYDVSDLGTVTPDLSRAQGALVVIYAATRVLVSEIRNRRTHTRYEAKGAVGEQDQAPSLLVQLLKDLQARKAELLEAQRRSGQTGAFAMADAYFMRATGHADGLDHRLGVL